MTCLRTAIKGRDAANSSTMLEAGSRKGGCYVIAGESEPAAARQRERSGGEGGSPREAAKADRPGYGESFDAGEDPGSDCHRRPASAGEEARGAGAAGRRGAPQGGT